MGGSVPVKQKPPDVPEHGRIWSRCSPQSPSAGAHAGTIPSRGRAFRLWANGVASGGQVKTKGAQTKRELWPVYAVTRFA
jgi:hypothetical protein